MTVLEYIGHVLHQRYIHYSDRTYADQFRNINPSYLDDDIDF